jgi:hypothetical protein
MAALQGETAEVAREAQARVRRAADYARALGGEGARVGAVFEFDDALVDAATRRAVAPVCELARWCASVGVDVHVVCGRGVDDRTLQRDVRPFLAREQIPAAAIHALSADGVRALAACADDGERAACLARLKRRIRRDIERQQPCRIALNVGTRWADVLPAGAAGLGAGADGEGAAHLLWVHCAAEPAGWALKLPRPGAHTRAISGA